MKKNERIKIEIDTYEPQQIKLSFSTSFSTAGRPTVVTLDEEDCRWLMRKLAHINNPEMGDICETIIKHN